MSEAFSIKSIVDFILTNHQQMAEVNRIFPLTDMAKASMMEILYKKVFKDLGPFVEANDEQHKLVVAIIESFMSGWAFGHESGR